HHRHQPNLRPELLHRHQLLSGQQRSHHLHSNQSRHPFLTASCCHPREARLPAGLPCVFTPICPLHNEQLEQNQNWCTHRPPADSWIAVSLQLMNQECRHSRCHHPRHVNRDFA